MAGVTDASYRRFIKRLAPQAITYTEFLSADAIVYGAEKTLNMLSFDPSLERPFIVQVFGADPAHFLEACRIVEQLGADGIDINMGCPAAKIVSSCYGSALIRRPELAAEVVHAARRAVSIPVSVKTRLGWDTPDTLIPFCRTVVDAGASALAIHGRLYRDKFSGTADWNPIYALKREVTVPVIGNGDIASVEDALQKIGNLDGVMVGRGTIGNPWLLADIGRAFERFSPAHPPCIVVRSTDAASHEQRANDEPTQYSGLRFSAMTFEQKIPFILEHCELAVRVKGERRGVLEMRRHFSGYVKGFDGAKELRMKLMETTKYEEVRGLLSV